MKRGEIYYIEAHHAVGSEMAKARPGIIVSNDILNATSPVVEVVFLTTNTSKPMPTHVAITSTGRPSAALCEQINAVSVQRIGDYCATCTDEEMDEIDQALLCSLGIELVEDEEPDDYDAPTFVTAIVPRPSVAEKADDPVNHPSHYTDGKIEVIDFIEDKKLGFHRGNAVKYIARAGKKDPTKTVQDLEKAKWYIEREIARLEGQAYAAN